MEQELVDKISNSGIKKSKIERDLEMPENSLSGMVNGKRDTPPKWSKAISEYLDKNKREFGRSDGSVVTETPEWAKVKEIEMDSTEQAMWGILNNYCTTAKISIAYLISFHDIHMQMEAVNKEVIPKERDISYSSKKAWELDQKKKSTTLKNLFRWSIPIFMVTEIPTQPTPATVVGTGHHTIHRGNQSQ